GTRQAGGGPPPAKQLAQRGAGLPHEDSDRGCNGEPERHGRKRDPFDLAPAGREGEQHAHQGHDKHKHQQEPARGRRVQNRGRMRHHAALGSVFALGGASARRVAEPVTWNSRSNSATARAAAAKATTIPGMTSAWGTGSPPNPEAAPLRATTPKTRNTPLPSRLKARILRSG